MQQQPRSSVPASLATPYAKFLRSVQAIDRTIDVAVIIIILLPLVLLLLSDKWIHSPAGYIDAWLYNGYFRELPQILKAFPNLYHGTRLSWILPGYLLYRVFPPITANYILHLGVYYAATFSLYLIARIGFNRYVALLTTILMGCYAYFLVSAGWDGVDGVGVAYFLVTLLFITKAAHSPHWLFWMAGAGMACAGFLYSNIYWIMLTPLVAAYFLFFKSHYQKQRILSRALAFGAGAVILTLILGIFNFLINGNFLFFAPTFSAASAPLDWIRLLTLPLQYWVPSASWFACPLVGLLASIFFLLRKDVRLAGKQNSLLIVFPALFIVAFGIFLMSHFLQLLPVFQYSYYTSFLIPFLFLSIGAQVFFYREANDHQQPILIGCALVLMVLPYAFAGKIGQVFPYWQVLSIFPAFLFVLISLLVLSRPWELVGKTVFSVLMFSLANLSIYPQNPVQFTVANTPSSYYATIDSFDAISQVSSLTDIYLWYQYADPQSKLYVSVAAFPLIVHAQIASRVSDNFPSLTSKMVGFYAPLKPGAKMAIFSTELHGFEQARGTLQRAGLDARLLSVREIHRDSVQFTITFVEVIAGRETF